MKISKKIILALFAVTLVCAGAVGVNVHEATADTSEPASAWNLRCSNADDPVKKHCEVFQKISVSKTGQRLMEFAVSEDKNGTGISRAVVVLPLGILLKPGVMLSIDDAHKYRFDINHCNEMGCIAFIDMNSDIVSQMKRGNAGALMLYTIDKKPLKIPVSLNGFTKAFGQLAR